MKVITHSPLKEGLFKDAEQYSISLRENIVLRKAKFEKSTHWSEKNAPCFFLLS